MKRILSYIIAVMLVAAMIPYTALGAEETENTESTGTGSGSAVECTYEEVTIGQSEEVTMYFYTDRDISIENADPMVAYGAVIRSSLIITNGSASYGKTIKITPVKIGETSFTVKSGDEELRRYCITVKPEDFSIESHFGQSAVIEFVSCYDEEILFAETEGVSPAVLSKTQRTSSYEINNVTVTEIKYVYRMQFDFSQPGTFSYTVSGSQTGDFYNVTSKVVDHIWDSEYTVDKPATCTEEGSESIHCTECESFKDERSIPVTDHSYEWVEDRAPTEFEDGLKHEECTGCGDIRNENTPVDKYAHEHDMTKHAAVKATCVTAGAIAYYMCDSCGKTFADKSGETELTAEEIIIPAMGHNEVVVTAVAATCTEDGATEGRQCGNCGEIFLASKIIMAKGHSYEWVVDKEATESENGLQHEECTECGDVINENTVIENLAHVHMMERTLGVPETCTRDGNTEYYTCRTCGKIFADSDATRPITQEETVIKAGGHSYGPWKVISRSTCERKGYEFTSCEKCGIAEIREMPLKEHRFTYSVIAPTCTENGENVSLCTGCNLRISEYIPPNGHKEVPFEIEASCTYTGVTGATKCSVCEKVMQEGTSTPVKNHVREIIPAVEATCTSEGMTEGVKCKVCKQIVKAQQTVPMKSHRVYTEKIRASISAAGYVQHICKDCSKLISRTSILRVRTVELSDTEYIYDGKIKTPAVSVKNTKDNKLAKGVDYTVKYINSSGKVVTKPSKVGTYKAKVTFKGNYTGSVTKSYKILPKGVSVSGVSGGKKQFKVSWKKPAAKYRKQMDGYQIRYATGKSGLSKAKPVTVKGTSATGKTIKKVKTKKKYYVQIRTYNKIGSKIYYSGWSGYKTVKTK